MSTDPTTRDFEELPQAPLVHLQLPIDDFMVMLEHAFYGHGGLRQRIRDLVEDGERESDNEPERAGLCPERGQRAPTKKLNENGEMELVLSSGNFFDRFSDLLGPDELVTMLDHHCWQEQVVGVYQLLHERYRDDPKASAWIRKDTAQLDELLHAGQPDIDPNDIPY